MADYRNQIVKGQEITLKNENLAHKLAHGLIMEDCIINFKTTGRRLICTDAHFINCTLNFKTKLVNFPFTEVLFEGCKFTGKLSGCEFGDRQRMDGYQDRKIKAGISNCDFSEMTLIDQIRFIDCDVSTLTFPSFPTFIIYEPLKNSSYLVNEDFPEMLKISFDYRGYLQDYDKAVLFDAEIMSKKYDIPLEKLQSILSKYDFVKM